MIDFTLDYDRLKWKNFLEDSFLPDDFQSQNQETDFSDKYSNKVTILGECPSLKLNVFEVIHSSAKDARVGLIKEAYSFIRKYSRYSRALILFVPENSKNSIYRFSLFEYTPVITEAGNIQRMTSNPRRYSFVLGKSKGCMRNTPKKYLISEGRIREQTRNRKRYTLLEDLKYRFSVEVLTDEFFKKLFNWYDTWAVNLVKFPLGSGKNARLPSQPEIKENRLHLIRLITRLIFIWFLKQKENIIPDWIFDVDEIKNILNDFKEHDNKKGTYYNAVLQNLFFATLNREIDQRRFFDEEDGKDSYSIKTLFRDHIDKPMISIEHKNFLKMFENIPFLNGGLFECLDNREAWEEQKYIDGFSRESKRAAFVPNCLFWGDEQHQGLFSLFSEYNFTIEENTPQDIDIALDPELLGKVFENLLATYDEKTEKPARKYSGSFYTPREVVDYMVSSSLKAYLKSKIIKELPEINENELLLDSLFMSDKTVENLTPKQTEKLIEILKSCKILDPACGSGAFPMGILNKLIMLLGKMDPENKTWKDEYRRKLYLIENCIYGVDIQSIAVQISKLRFFISLIIEQNIRKSEANLGISPLPNLETKFVTANTLIRLSKNEDGILPDTRIDDLQEKLLKKRHEHFFAKNTDDKKRIREEDEKITNELIEILKENTAFSPDSVRQITEWNPYKPDITAPFFDMYWMFGIEEGFDIVIGNPPYFVIKNDEENKSKYEEIYTKLQSGRMNIYQLFMGCSANLLSKYGILTFIHPKTLLSDNYLTSTRDFLISKFSSFNIINIVSRTDTFPAVLQSVVISLWNNNKNKQEYNVSEIYNKSEFENIRLLSLKKTEIISPFNTFVVSNNQISYQIIDKILKYEIISLDFKTGSIEWNKYKNKLSGIKKESSKRLIYGENIQRFYFAESSQREDTTFLNDKAPVPIITDTLIMTQRTTAVEQPYRIISSIINPKDFDVPIVSENHTCVFICNDTKMSYYILGILNSKLIDFYFRLFNSNTQVAMSELNRVPILKPNKIQSDKIKSISQDICKIKSKNNDADTSELERQLNNYVYKMYNLSYNEVKIIEPDFSMSKSEYDNISVGDN